MINFLNVVLIFALMQTVFACVHNSTLLTGDLDLIMEKRFPIAPGNDLRIKISGGDVAITTWSKGEVYIKVLGNENAAEQFDFIFDNSDSYVHLKTKSKSSLSNWFSSIQLKIEVKVPERFNTDIHTSGGDIKLEGVEGENSLNTSGGDVTCKDFYGSLDVTTSGGDIRLSGESTPINAHTSGGDIKLNYSGKNSGIDLSTSGGDIEVILPDDFNADMEISTSGGDVSCNLTLNNTVKISEHKIVAKLNNGGNKFLAHTSGGDIDVRKTD